MAGLLRYLGLALALLLLVLLNDAKKVGTSRSSSGARRGDLLTGRPPARTFFLG